MAVVRLFQQELLVSDVELCVSGDEVGEDLGVFDVLESLGGFGGNAVGAEDRAEFLAQLRSLRADSGAFEQSVVLVDGAERGAEEGRVLFYDLAEAEPFVALEDAQLVAVGEVHHLEAAQTDCQEESYKKNDDNEGDTPDIAIDGIKKSG